MSISKLTMKTKIILTLQVLLISIVCNGQEYAFKVLVNKGQNEVKNGNEWKPIKVGSSLTIKDEIKLAANGYLGLVHKTGKPLELKGQGAHKIKALEDGIQKKGASVVEKYADFILSSNADNKNTLKATGAVHRGPETINVYLPTSPAYTIVYSSKVIISWDASKLKGPFTLTFSNPFEDELLKVETADSSLTINLQEEAFKNEDNIKIKVRSRQDQMESPDQLILKRLSKADMDRIGKQLQELYAVMDENTALSKYYLAGFFESQNLLIDASTFYQEAIRLAPDVEEYRGLYKAFLLRSGIKNPKEK
jgi:hypothetical protein